MRACSIVAKAQGVDFNQVLVRFALERILYRLSQSPHADRFLLKARCCSRSGTTCRTLRDADLLGFGASDLASLRSLPGHRSRRGRRRYRFDPASVTVEEIRKEAGYAAFA